MLAGELAGELADELTSELAGELAGEQVDRLAGELVGEEIIAPWGTVLTRSTSKKSLLPVWRRNKSKACTECNSTMTCSD